MKFIVLAVVIALAAFYFTKKSSDKKLALENRAIANDFLAKNKESKEVIETASGLQYQILGKGQGEAHPPRCANKPSSGGIPMGI